MATSQAQPVPNILIVDDRPANLQLLVGMLTSRGYNLRTALSGRLALEAARAEVPDLILLDVAMPEMNGYEVCEQLKADANLRHIPVIFISALHETIDKVKAFRVGAVDYVTKPFHFEEVHARVETHLRMGSLQHQLGEQNHRLECVVAERTRDLLEAFDRLRVLGGIKDDFLSMISHELRTPANGLMNLGNMILDLCPDSAERTLYAGMFGQCATRLRNLIEDATIISDMELLAVKKGAASSFPEILAVVAAALPEIHIACQPSAGPDTFFPKGYPPLLKRALESMVRLASFFSSDPTAVHLRWRVDGQTLHLHLALDALSLTSEQIAGFFAIESAARAISSAESLGLAPVLAHQIMTIFGGRMRLVDGAGNNGYLEVVLVGEANHGR